MAAERVEGPAPQAEIVNCNKCGGTHPWSREGCPEGVAATAYSIRDGALPDLTEIPRIGSRQRDSDERDVMARARELVHQEDGRLRDALTQLEWDIRGINEHGAETHRSPKSHDLARDYARMLVNHVEQCWATAVLR